MTKTLDRVNKLISTISSNFYVKFGRILDYYFINQFKFILYYRIK
jgi:hypothetical protein